MASHDNIDWAFIGGNEGGQSLRGYLPLSMAFKGKLAYFGDW